MNVEEFANRMMELMPQIMKGVARHENNYLTNGKITFPQYWVLLHLVKQSETKMSTLAQTLGVSKPSATGTVDRLIAQGFVHRQHDESDRRIVWITVTAKGKKVVNDILHQKQQTTIKIFSAISDNDRKKHLQLFEQMAKILNPSDNLPRPKSAKKEIKGIA